MSRQRLWLLSIAILLTAFSYALAQRAPSGSPEPGYQPIEILPGDVATGRLVDVNKNELRVNTAKDPCDQNKEGILTFYAPFEWSKIGEVCNGEMKVQVVKQ